MSEIQVIHRAFAILNLIADQPAGLSVAEISSQLNLPKSTTSRILSNLAAFNAVSTTSDHRWSIGPGLVRLARQQSFTATLAALARPSLEMAAAESREAILLSVLDGRHVHYLDHVETPQPVRVENWVGGRLPLSVTSAGKLFLAYGTDEQLTQYLTQPLATYTEQTLTTADDLHRELDLVRQRGYATGNEEYREGVSGLSVPLCNDDDQIIAAITLYGPTYRVGAPDRQDALIAALFKARDQLRRRV